MTAKGLETESIFQLVERFVELTKEYNRTVEATWENPRLRLAKGFKEKRLLRKDVLVTTELLKRYKGVMYEIYKSGGNSPLTNESFQEVQDATWLIVKDRAVVMSNHNNFFGALWSAYSGRMKRRDAISQYKPKFMLLPFVDAMPAGEERRVLWGAYGSQEEFNETEKALAKKLTGAFSVLYKELKSRGPEMATLTDGLTNDGEISSIVSPFEKLRKWIFRI